MPNTATTHEVAQLTAAHLADWDYVKGKHGNALLANGQRRIHFCDMPGVAKAGRIHIAPILPMHTADGKHVGTPYGLKTPAITVAATRDPKAIARAIESRLLADAVAAFEAAESHRAGYEAHYYSKDAALKTVESAGHGTVHDFAHKDEKYIRLDLPEGTYGDFKPSSDDSHSLELSGLPMEKVLAILAIVRDAA